MRKIRYSVIALSLLLTFSLTSSIIVTPNMPHSIDALSKSMNLSDVTLLLTWTSRTQTESLPINNGSSLVGDHVLVNATFPDSMNVTYCEIRFWNITANVNITFSNTSSTIIVDTYYLHHQNLTYNIHVIGESSKLETWNIFQQDVEICNFFRPQVYVFTPVSLVIDHRTYNLTWFSTDNNEDEVNYYSIWVSNNDGVSFMLLIHNVTKTWYIWNSTGWLEDTYMIRIRAYSIDLFYPNLDLSNPPLGYLPGDYSDGFSPCFEGNGPPPPDGITSETNQVTTTSYTDDHIPDFPIVIIISSLALASLAIVIVLIIKRKG